MNKPLSPLRPSRPAVQNQGLESRLQAVPFRVYNSLPGFTETRISNSLVLRIKNASAAGAQPADEPAEILIYDEIGQNWDGTGITAADFKRALDAVPAGRDIRLRINSPGGLVTDGLAIHNLIAQHKGGKITARIDGIAASAASFIPMACASIEMPRTAQMFIHDAWGYCVGPADDMTQAAEMLNTCSEQIAAIYAAKNGKSVAAMRQKMRDETLLTGQAAYDLGLVNTLLDAAPIKNFSPEEIATIRAKLRGAQKNASPTPAHPTTQNQNPTTEELPMKRTLLESLAKRLGLTYEASITDAALLAQIEAASVPNGTAAAAAPAGTPNAAGSPSTANAPAAAVNAAVASTVEDIAALRTQINSLTEANNTAKKLRITATIDALIANDQLPQINREKSIARAMADETILDEFRALPSRPPGTDPVNGAVNIEIIGESVQDVNKFVVTNGPGLMRQFTGSAGAGRDITPAICKDISNRAIRVARAVSDPKIRAKIMEAWNTNTIDADLQRTVILQDMVREYAKRILPLSAFSTGYYNVPLEGTDKVTVPFFPLQTNASTDWVAGTGYVAGNTTQNTRTVTINRRKYQAMAFTSQELRRQPYQNWAQLLTMNAEQLGVDVNADVLSLVTVANYGASVKAVPAAAFGADDVAELYGACTDLNWGDIGRSLILTTPYKVALLKDNAFRSALSYGDSDPIRKGMIQQAYGFQDIYTIPTANLPTNGQNLSGFICRNNAALVATSPIMPGPAVRAVMVQYDIAVDPVNGTALEYKYFGNAQLDNTIEVVESNYGFAKGVASSLARITTQ